MIPEAVWSSDTLAPVHSPVQFLVPRPARLTSKSPSYRYVTSSMLGLCPSRAGPERGIRSPRWPSLGLSCRLSSRQWMR